MRRVGRAGNRAMADNDAISQTIDLAPALRNSDPGGSTMITQQRLCGAIVSVIMSMGLTVSANAGQQMKHSGSIFFIADDATTFVLAEVGPWKVRHGGTVMTYRTITVTPETEFAIVARRDAGANAWAGEFVEMPIGADGLYLNDFVTIDCVHEGSRLIALKITVTEVLPAIDTELVGRR